VESCNCLGSMDDGERPGAGVGDADSDPIEEDILPGELYGVRRRRIYDSSSGARSVWDLSEF
jgi:hypothetical protein